MKRSIFCGLLAAMLMSTPAQAAQIEQTERAERSVIVQVGRPLAGQPGRGT